MAILNYNIGNLASVKNAFKSIGAEAEIVSEAGEIRRFDKLILPGVGAFENAMRHLEETGAKEAVLDFVANGKDMLGICLGMQLLFDKSYEFGTHLGLGLIAGEVVKFGDSTKLDSADFIDSANPDSAINLTNLDSATSATTSQNPHNFTRKIPHMGWNAIDICRDSPLLRGIPNGAYLYFVHSYYVRAENPADTIASCDYGDRFSAIVGRENVYGIQPHPEKSSSVGLKILKNFVDL
ncbi:hypothetical protein CCY99_08795 [Helicobacter sp. 16-1353]|nr:hypothetical protein CCY99_08795 [Helicobacter sp. 16-1353]